MILKNGEKLRKTRTRYINQSIHLYNMAIKSAFLRLSPPEIKQFNIKKIYLSTIRGVELWRRSGLKRGIGSLTLICQANSPISPNFFLQLVTSQNCGLPQFCSFQREKKTSFKPDVKLNKFEVLKLEGGIFLKRKHYISAWLFY